MIWINLIRIERKVGLMKVEEIEIKIEIVKVVDESKVDFWKMSMGIVEMDLIGEDEIMVGMGKKIKKEMKERINIEIKIGGKNKEISFIEVDSGEEELIRIKMMNKGNEEIIIEVLKKMEKLGLGKEKLFGIGCSGKSKVIIGRKRKEIGIIDEEKKIVIIGEKREKKEDIEFESRVGNIERRKIGKRNEKKIKKEKIEKKGFSWNVKDDIERIDMKKKGIVWIIGEGLEGGIGEIVECGDLKVDELGDIREKKSIISSIEEKEVKKEIEENVGKIDMVGIDKVEVEIKDLEIEGRGNEEGLMVIGKIVGEKKVEVILNEKIKLRGKGVKIEIIEELIWMKKNEGVWIDMVIGWKGIMRMGRRGENWERKKRKRKEERKWSKERKERESMGK